MSERCHAMEWGISRVSCKTTKCTSRCCRGTGGPSRAQDRQLRDRASLFVMGNQCSGPNRIELTSGTWLSPAHISLAALNRPVWLPLWRPLSLPYPRYTPTPSYACWARCIAISSSVDAPEYDPGREEKDFFGGLSLVKPKTPQDKGEGDMINRTWLDPGWDSDAHS